MKRDHQSVWITGVGALSSLGTNFAETAAGLVAGRSGIRRVENFDISQHPCQMAGQVLEVPCPAGFEAQAFAGLNRLEQCALHCGAEALRDSGLWERRQASRIGIVLGLGSEWSEVWEQDVARHGQRLYRPELDQESIGPRLERHLSISGPTLSVAAACASGNHAIEQARQWLALGLVDVCLAGGCDMGVSPFSLGAFGNLRALSRRNDAPAQALRPFDAYRDGMVLGEGGAMFVLEHGASARRRGATPYAEVAGCGSSSDAHHMVIPAPSGEQAAIALRAAMAEARIEPHEIDYINAHATGTPVGDLVETQVLCQALGECARTIPISSTKSMTGHMLSAAAAVEAVACLIALRDHVIPPTINLDEVDPRCELNHVANVAREQRVRMALSNSFGFGGNNTTLILRAVA